MIDEHRQDLAAEYALDALDPESARAFEAILASDAELKALSDQLRETAATLAQAAPQQLPPPELRERVLARIRGEAQGDTPETPVAPPASAPAPATVAPQTGGWNLLPRALAAGFAITTASLWLERNQWRQDSQNLRQEALRLRNANVLDQMRIATLSAQVEAYSKASAVIVWDAKKQHGIVQLSNIPRPEPGKDYQLWVIDPKYPNPVNGGLVPVDDNGLARVDFKPDQPIKTAAKFAISVEPAGGVPKATGPIVFLGN